MKNRQKRWSAIIFLLILIILPIMTFASKKEYFSEIENKSLARMPKLTISKVKDKSFMNGFESFFADHFTGRIKWIETKVDAELLVGKTELNGIYVCDNMLLEHLPNPDYAEVDKAVSAINGFATENSGVPVSVMLAPTSGGIYTDKLPKNAPQLDQKAFIDYVYSELGENITKIDIYNTLYTARTDNYIYYRNDHHWTSLGAYYAYNTAIQKLGFSPVSYDRFDIEHASGDFRGTFYSKTLYKKTDADTVDIYKYDAGANVTDVTITKAINPDGSLQTEQHDGLYFREFLNQKDKYCTFLGSNQPMVDIKTDVRNDKKILIIKDSYANCFVPFLINHYSEITLLDLRYIQTSYKKLVNVSDYTNVLFLYNASTFSTDENLKKLMYNY